MIKGTGRIIFLLISFLVITFCALAQNSAIKFDRLSINDGLSHGVVHCVLNDSRGFMWFGTDDGLNKYDGYKFVVYKPEAGNNSSISSNIIKCIYEDRQGVLWIGTAGGGLNRFNRDDETFTRYNFERDVSTSLSDDNVYVIYEDSRNNFWVGTFGGGLNLMDRKKGEFTRFKHNPKIPGTISGDAIRAIVEDRYGVLWVGVDEGGLDRYERDTKSFTNWSHDPLNKNSLSSNAVLSIFIDHKGYFWIGTWAGGVNFFDPDKEIFKAYKNDQNNSNSISSNETFGICEDLQNRLWFTTRNGIDIFNPETNQFTHNIYDPYNNRSISHNFGTCLYEDKMGILWIGTGGGGLNKFDQNGKKFGHIKKDVTTINTLSADDIYAVFEDKDHNIWIGTKDGGVNFINTKTNNFTHFTHSNNPESLTHNTVRTIQQDKKGNIWIGTDGGGINVLDPKTGKVIKVYKHDDKNVNSIKNDAIYDLLIDSEGTVWIGTYGGGLDVYSPSQNKFRNFSLNNRNQMQNVVLDIEEDSRGRIWIGSLGMGLWEFDKSRGKLVSYKKYIKDSSTISNMVVNDIFIDRKGVLWLGTGGNGLDKFDTRIGKIINYGQGNGLNNNVICAIQEDEKYNFWVSTNNGLAKFDPYSEKFLNYSISDGIQDVMFNPRASCVTENRIFYFGGINGINMFDPDSIKSNPHLPNVVLTDFKLFNNSVKVGKNSPLTKHISEVEELILNHKQNVISFEFAALHFVSPGKNLYKYKLEGFDEDWITTNANRRFASYTNLQGGEYTFRVIASNNDGEWNDEGVSLRILIVPPFWKTIPFYGMVVLLVLVLIYFYIKQREKQFKLKEEILEEKVRIRTDEIKSQKEELQFINEQLQQQQEELKSQSEYLRQINNQLNDQRNQLQFKTDMLAAANIELKNKNQLITESIKYAQKIQDSILPNKSILDKVFDDCFILFKPKDIVSGDFYWIANVDTDEWGKPIEKTYIAAVDCTGHGVPGAFMSMIGHTLLNEIVITKGIRKPSQILKELNHEIITALAKDGKDYQDDGMDISVCSIDYQLEEIQVACAMQTIYLIRKGELTAVEGDIFSIGELLSILKNPDFTNHIFDFEKGDCVYLFSDGYQDQFGGKNGCKFMEMHFRELILSNYQKSFKEQKNILENTFTEWKGDNNQIDDIMVIGFKL